MILIFLTILFLAGNGLTFQKFNQRTSSFKPQDLDNFLIANLTANTTESAWISNNTNFTHLVQQYKYNPSSLAKNSKNNFSIHFIRRVRAFSYDEIAREMEKEHSGGFFDGSDFQVLLNLYWANKSGMQESLQRFAKDNLESVQLLEHFNDLLDQNFNISRNMTNNFPSVSVVPYPIEFLNKFRFLLYNQKYQHFEERSLHPMKVDSLLYMQMLMKFGKQPDTMIELNNHINSLGDEIFLKNILLEFVKQLNASKNKFPHINVLAFSPGSVASFYDTMTRRVNDLGLIPVKEAMRFLDYKNLEKYVYNFDKEKSSGYLEGDDLFRLHSLLKSNLSNEYSIILKNSAKQDGSFIDLINTIMLNSNKVPGAFNKYLYSKELITGLHSAINRTWTLVRNEELKRYNMGLFTWNDVFTLKSLRNVSKMNDELNKYAKKKLHVIKHQENFSKLIKKSRNSSQVIVDDQLYPIEFINGTRYIYYKHLFQSELNTELNDLNNLRLCFKFENSTEFSSQLLNLVNSLDDVNLKNNFTDLLIQLKLNPDVLPAISKLSYPASFVNRLRSMYYDQISTQLAKESNQTNGFFRSSDFINLKNLITSSANSTLFLQKLHDFGVEYLESLGSSLSVIENYIDMVNQFKETSGNIIPAVSFVFYPMEFINELRAYFSFKD